MTIRATVKHDNAPLLFCIHMFFFFLFFFLWNIFQGMCICSVIHWTRLREKFHLLSSYCGNWFKRDYTSTQQDLDTSNFNNYSHLSSGKNTYQHRSLRNGNMRNAGFHTHSSSFFIIRSCHDFNFCFTKVWDGILHWLYLFYAPWRRLGESNVWIGVRDLGFHAALWGSTRMMLSVTVVSLSIIALYLIHS